MNVLGTRGNTTHTQKKKGPGKLNIDKKKQMEIIE